MQEILCELAESRTAAWPAPSNLGYQFITFTIILYKDSIYKLKHTHNLQDLHKRIKNGYSSGHPMPGSLLSEAFFSLVLVNLV